MKKYFSITLAFIISICYCLPAFASDSSILISKNNISHPVSENLYGLSLGDSSFVIDGGLNANMVNNNSFEYKNNAEYSWTFSNTQNVVSFDSPISKTNPTYETLTIDGRGIITNSGYGEMYFQKGVSYEFSCFLKNIDFDGSFGVYLDSSSNKKDDVNVNISNVDNSWKKVSAKIKSSETESGKLALKFRGKGTICIDYVSLVPTNSYGYGHENWKNGMLRADMVDAIKNLNPRFIRFAAENQAISTGEGEFFTWKNTIGPLEKRTQASNVNDDYFNECAYQNSNIIGCQEYFQLCADLNTKPILVVGAGIKNQSKEDYEAYLQALNKTYMDDDQWKEYLKGEFGIKGKEFKERTEYINSLGIKTADDFNKYVNSISLKPNSSKFLNYVQDIIDIIEFANGDAQDTYWGSVRANNGSVQPFNLEYVQIGDENWGDVYWRNFDAIKKAIEQVYPDITVIASTGEVAQGEIFENAKSQISSRNKAIANEQYFTDKKNKFEDNVNVFDSYDRASAGVMVGKYACTDMKAKKGVANNNLYTSTQQAVFITGAERNSDVVKFLSPSNMFANINNATVNQSLVWINLNDLVFTTDYYTQMIFANNIGTNVVNAILSTDNKRLFEATTVNENANAIFVKLVNTSGKKESININLDGFGDINSASVQAVDGKNREAFNSEKKQAILPHTDELEYKNNNTQVELMPYSACVVRIAYGNNSGKGFFALNDEINTEVKSHSPMSKVGFVIMMILIFAVATLITYLVYSKVILKGKKFKFVSKNKNKKNDID